MVSTEAKKIIGGLRSLIKLARVANYEIVWIHGHNGHCYYWANKIELGKHLPNSEKLVVLAHELGHIFDYTDNPPSIDEVVSMLKFADAYQVGTAYYNREVSAWGYAQYLLEQIGCWDVARPKFEACKSVALAAYKLRKDAAEKNGTNIPEPKAFAEAKEKVERQQGKDEFIKFIKDS